MATHDYVLDNQSGADFRSDLNNALQAIVTNNSSTSEPSTTFAYQIWIDTTNSLAKIRNSTNNGWITLPFSISSDNTVDINGGTANGISSLSFTSGQTVTSILDEDNFSSNSDTALATQQSIKAYVDNQVTIQDLDISDGSNTIAIDLDSETLSLLGGTGVTSTASSNSVTFAIGQSVGTGDDVVFNQVTSALVGNASTATALQTARTINNTSFDGTANISFDTDEVSEGTSNLYYTDARFDTRLATKTTSNLTEGTNLYYTDARFDTRLATKDTGDLTEGTNLYYTDARFDTRLATKDTGDLSEGTNLYYTDSRADARINLQTGTNLDLSNKSTSDLSEGTNLYYTDTRFDTRLATKDTDDLTEGSSNLYYTNTRANSAIDARVTQSFVNALNVNAASVDDNSVALGTKTTGNYVQDITGTTNEVEVTGSGSESSSVTIGLPNNVVIAGNLTVNGTTVTVNTDTLSVEDPLIKLAKNNDTTDSVDIGFYGLYDTTGSQDLYAGLFRDANDSGKFKLFKDLQTEPTTTVNTAGTGYTVATLVANLEGNVTGTVSSISNHSTSDLSEGTNLYYTDARFDTRLGTKDTDDLSEGSTNLYYTDARANAAIDARVTNTFINNLTGVVADTATALETARTINGVSFDGTANITTLTAGTGVSVSGTQVSIGQAVGTSDSPTFADLSLTTLGITNTTTNDSLLITTTEDSSTAAPVITLKRNSGSPADGDYLGQLKFKGENDADQEVIYAKITGKISDASNTTEDGLLEFTLKKAGSNNIGARLTSTDLKLINGTGLEVAGDATISGAFTSQGIDDNADATAITIDSSERVILEKNLHLLGGVDQRIQLSTSGTGSSPSTTDNNCHIRGNDDDLILNSAGNGNILFQENGTERLKINSGGVVDVANSMSFTANAFTFADSKIGTASNNYMYVYGGSAGLIIGDNSGGNNRLVIRDSNTMEFEVNGSERMRITSSGVVDIKSGGTSSLPSLIFEGDTDTGFFHGTNVLAIATSGSERMRIDSSGRVGINTSSPSAKLEVQEGSASTYTALIQHLGNPNSGPPQVLKLGFQYTPNNGTSEFARCVDTLNGTAVARAIIMSNGGLANYQSNNANLSDEREKKNIVNAGDQLENIKGLSIKSFHYNEDDDSDDKRLGIIAQDIESSLPNLVTDFNKSDTETRKGVKEQQFMWMAIKAIQEQQEIIDDLKTRIEALEG